MIKRKITMLRSQKEEAKSITRQVVKIKMDAGYAPIKRGDLLTTSPTPGYAMVVRDYAKAQGAILGKAMEGLPEGEKGQILVLVTLQ